MQMTVYAKTERENIYRNGITLHVRSVIWGDQADVTGISDIEMNVGFDIPTYSLESW